MSPFLSVSPAVQQRLCRGTQNLRVQLEPFWRGQGGPGPPVEHALCPYTVRPLDRAHPSAPPAADVPVFLSHLAQPSPFPSPEAILVARPHHLLGPPLGVPPRIPAEHSQTENTSFIKPHVLYPRFQHPRATPPTRGRPAAPAGRALQPPWARALFLLVLAGLRCDLTFVVLVARGAADGVPTGARVLRGEASAPSSSKQWGGEAGPAGPGGGGRAAESGLSRFSAASTQMPSSHVPGSHAFPAQRACHVS